ncbi:amine oxidase [Plakobranchus ocellatus]|uniref:Amine oxidase n=1 Tax=Plakobranchus ocellatus TaxID=259542 RepID=A0AAV4A7A5_9GAST|nr:amine oxidase [Plakobranchus ocellatus]
MSYERAKHALFPLAVSTHVKSQQDIATGPLKTPHRSKKLTDSSTSPMLKGTLLSPETEAKTTKPLTNEEELLSTYLIRRKLNTPGTKDTVRLKTKGQPLFLQKITMPRKGSSTVKSPLKCKREKHLENFRLKMSGSLEADTLKQKASEFKSLNKTAKAKITSLLGLRRGKFTVAETRAMKEAMNMTYQMRLQSKFLKTIGSNLPNEHAVRRLHKQITAGDIAVKIKTFQNKKMKQEYDLEVAYIRDILQFVTKKLEEHDKGGELNWHDGKIPQNEVWIKIGGDHGKNSFKVALSIFNLSKPNAKQNTHLIVMAKVPDTMHNMQIMLDDLKPQIESLQSFTWRGKAMKVFIFGDYWFLCKLYGLSGPSSMIVV